MFIRGIDTWFGVLIKKTAGIAARFHHNSKIRKLIRPIINIEAKQIIFNYQVRNFALDITAFTINLHQHVKCIDKDVPTPNT